ncbi:hypothetical protein F5I97DRAFT_1283367 [Phlebopus sp. FC_14]|nr:hypothetical protein F5I97DRAFT_1283367 [Phlebopus sp. FC_14]
MNQKNPLKELPPSGKEPSLTPAETKASTASMSSSRPLLPSRAHQTKPKLKPSSSTPPCARTHTQNPDLWQVASSQSTGSNHPFFPNPPILVLSVTSLNEWQDPDHLACRFQGQRKQVRTANVLPPSNSCWKPPQQRNTGTKAPRAPFYFLGRPQKCAARGRWWAVPLVAFSPFSLVKTFLIAICFCLEGGDGGGGDCKIDRGGDGSKNG